MTYVYLMKNNKTLSLEIIQRHVEHLRKLDAKGTLVLCGPFSDWFGKGRLLVHATFDGVPYDGQIVKMGTPCYIIGIWKDIRKQMGKSFGDPVHVTFGERNNQTK